MTSFTLHQEDHQKKLEKDQERDENMAKIMTQLDLLMKHMMGCGQKSVNVVGSASDMTFNGVDFDVGYNEGVYYMGNQMMGS